MNKEKNVGVSPLLGIPNARLGFIIKDGSVTIKKLAAEVLNLIYSSGGGSGGGIVQLIDLSDRMTGDNTTVTDMEVKTSLFLYNVYDRVSGIARVVEPETEDRYLLFKVCCYDGEENKILYVAYTTEDDFSTNATWHYYKTIDVEDALYPWAMSVFGDAVVDVENNLLTVGSIQYTLERYAGQDIITYEYSSPVVTNFTYPKVNANGEIVYPTINFRQNITRRVTNGAGETEETIILTGVFDKTGTSYSDLSLVDSQAVFNFTGNNPFISGGVDTVGAVNVGPSDVALEKVVRNVNVVMTLNGKSSEQKAAEVRQYPATIEAAKESLIDANGGQNLVKFTKTSGVTVEVSDVESTVDWIHIDNVNIRDNEVSVQYTVAVNSVTSSRDGLINVNTDITGLATHLSIRQSGQQTMISVDKSTVDFGVQYINGTYNDNVIVTGTNLTGNITVNKTGSSAFTVGAVSISPAQATGGYTLPVTFKPVTAGAVGGQIMLSSNNASTVTVTLRGTGQNAAPESITGYYGKGSTLPTELGSNTFPVTSGMTHHDDGGAQVIWIALPTSLNANVVGKGINGIAFIVYDDYRIGDYTVYYRQVVMPTGQTDFEITF